MYIIWLYVNKRNAVVIPPEKHQCSQAENTPSTMHKAAVALLCWAAPWMQYLFSQVSCFRVAGGDGGVVPQQQVVHGSAHNLTAAYDHRSLPGYGHTCRGSGSNVGCNDMKVHYFRECAVCTYLSVWSKSGSRWVCREWSNQPNPLEKVFLRWCWSVCKLTWRRWRSAGARVWKG